MPAGERYFRLLGIHGLSISPASIMTGRRARACG
jgi:hypothetical protein